MTSGFCIRAAPPYLPPLELLIQLLLQVDHVKPRCRGARHVLDPQLAVLSPFSVGDERCVNEQ